jgi:hypothetical protein
MRAEWLSEQTERFEIQTRFVFELSARRQVTEDFQFKARIMRALTFVLHETSLAGDHFE